jgi:hypothetical protein
MLLQAQGRSGPKGRHALTESMPKTAISGMSASVMDMTCFNILAS